MDGPLQRAERIARSYVGVGNSVKVQFTDTDKPPRICGQKALSARRNGKWIAIRKSTYHVKVGVNWAATHQLVKQTYPAVLLYSDVDDTPITPVVTQPQRAIKI